MGQDRNGWKGLYLDGQSALARPVLVTITPRGLRLRGDDGLTSYWPYAELRQTQDRHPGEHIRIERGLGEIVEALELTDPAFIVAVRAIAPAADLRGPLGPRVFAAW